MEDFINQYLAEMRDKEEKERNNIIGLIMRKCNINKLEIDEEELNSSVLNEVKQIYDAKNHRIILMLKGELNDMFKLC